ncbi:RagB/SusD family nutrient uptake outer membrane protein [Pedobacter endophyticus]|uniref:RagB/SusD family nutrient uptake outer membrane protein n=1 Tax=Pedobacter endophyticus TaxID=2789740 RepID=A0A7U3Q4W5_9SPHI|nr:RagB/SusD family nutrient uptake outer membrane protein [Pedobacter endophyticus]QPH38650.1 RagB/SusD family nutrient uptake outer membrane protein [Pedobacter endophyticus]
MMKKYNIGLSIVIFISMLFTLSCKKYLEVKSNARLVVPNTLADAQGLLDDANLMNLRIAPSFGEASSDDFFLPLTSYNALIVRGQEAYTWKPTPYRYGNDWSLAYAAVYNSNLCLELLQNIERTPSNSSLWDNAKGSALFYRSFYFLMLTNQYGLAFDEKTSENDLGIALRTSSNFNVPSVRASVSDCYRKIIEDATLALALLPDYPQHVLRPSKGAAAALLSRCYLYRHEYDLSLKYTLEALKLNNKLMDYNGDSDLLVLTSTVPIKKFNKETIWYAELSSNFGVNNTTNSRIDTTLYASYNANDLRRTAFFRASAPYQQFKGNYTASGTIYFSGLATDELYLNSAECKAFLNDLPGAMESLNTLLKSRWRNTVPFSPITASDRTDAIRKIREERRKELLMRGLRFADLKRYNKEGANITLRRVLGNQVFTLEPNSRYYALPLPSDIIESSGMQQN